MSSVRARLLNYALRVAVKRRLHRHLTVAAIRGAAAVVCARISSHEQASPGEPILCGTVRCERFAPPESAGQRTVLYLHGGGFVSHMPEAYRAFSRRLAHALDASVVVPDYQLAPEHRFPAGSDDCLSAYCGLIASGADSRRIVLAGDSAGGNLALVTAIRIRDAGLPAPGCVVLLSPATDLTGGSASLRYNCKRDPLIVPEVVPFLLSQYATTAMASHPWVSPIFADFRGLPPLLFHAGSTEVLLDDSIRAAERARAAGTSVALTVWPDVPHVFQMFHWLPEARAAWREILTFVRSHVPDGVLLPEPPPVLAHLTSSDAHP